MKRHTTVTITEKFLRSLGACYSGLEAALPFLPAKLSTDPEQNIALAASLTYGMFMRVTWLVEMLHNDTSLDVDYWFGTEGQLARYTNGDAIERCTDAMLIAQYLAWIADALATEEGR